MSSHTPGPWKVFDNRFIETDTEDTIFEAYLPYDEPQKEARAEMAGNLRLAAAAPEMKNALKLCVEWMDELGYESELAQDCRALLARIEGREE